MSFPSPEEFNKAVTDVKGRCLETVTQLRLLGHQYRIPSPHVSNQGLRFCADSVGGDSWDVVVLGPGTPFAEWSVDTLIAFDGCREKLLSEYQNHILLLYQFARGEVKPDPF